MKIAGYLVAMSLLPLATSVAAANEDGQVRAADARFWQAYNACDMKTIGGLLTADVEFYHDKTGLTVSREGLVESLRKGPCSDPKMRLRREAVDESLAFHPLKGGFAILSGKHRFYVREAGKPEHLDGQAEFTSLWKFDDGQWRMHRVLSYDHGPVPYTPPSVTLTLPASTLAAYAGHYRSPRIGDILVSVEGDHLKLAAGSFVATLYPETQTRFFAMERDLRFEFERGKEGNVQMLTVYENGAVSERAPRAGAD
jgi:ketosteroid isomerase-like protein